MSSTKTAVVVPSGKPGRKKGTPKTGGRQRGTPNKVTIEGREAAAELVDNPRYRARLLRDLVSRKLHPTIEGMLWHYAKGKPKDRIEHSGGITHAHLTEVEEDELLAMMEDDELAALRKAHEVEAAAKHRLAELRARSARRA